MRIFFYSIMILFFLASERSSYCQENKTIFPKGSINPIKVKNPGPSLNTNDIRFPKGSSFNTQAGFGASGSSFGQRLMRSSNLRTNGLQEHDLAHGPTLGDTVSEMTKLFARYPNGKGWIDYFCLNELRNLLVKDELDSPPGTLLLKKVARRIDQLRDKPQFKIIIDLDVVIEFKKAISALKKESSITASVPKKK